MTSIPDQIWAEIQQATHILLHCHPSPDPDSVGSVLAMKFALEGKGKKVTVIQGDSEIPRGFMHFPGAKDILKKNIFETDLTQFDLFIVLDSSEKGVSRIKDPVYPPSLTLINIDHHRSNPGFGKISFVDTLYPANCLLLFDLFKMWNICLTPEIAANLFIGSYADTGGFKYPGVSPQTFMAVSEMVRHIDNVPDLIAQMENSNTPGALAFESLALGSIRTEGSLAIAAVSLVALEQKGIRTEEAKAGMISGILRSVPEWKIGAAVVENEPGIVKCSFRSTTHDVSKLAMALGGGGHMGAAGAVLTMPFEGAVLKVVETAKMLYNL